MNLIFNKYLKERLFAKVRLGLLFFLPLSVFAIIVFVKLPILAYLIVVLYKWRIFIAHPKFWQLNLKINAVDLIVGLACVYFMSLASINLWQQLIWLGFYLAWMLYFKFIKRKHGYLIQGVVAQALGTTMISYGLTTWPVSIGLIGIWLVSLFSAYHIMNGFKEEKYQFHLVYLWSLFSTLLAWVLFHWQINFFVIPRLALIQILILITSGSLYILFQQSKLKSALGKQLIIFALVIVVVALLISSFQAVAV